MKIRMLATWIVILAGLEWLAEVVFFLPSPGEVTNPEGAILYSIRAVATGAIPLYRDYGMPPFSTTPYPPLYYWVCGLLGRWLGWGESLDGLLRLARAVTALSALGTAWVAARLARELFGQRVARLSLGVVLAVPALVATFRPWTFSARVDSLAVLLSLAAFTSWLLLERSRPLLAVILAAALSALAVWTKHSHAIAGIAIGVMLLSERRWKEATLLAGVFVVLVVPGAWALNQAMGGLFFRNLFEANATEVRWDQLGWLFRGGFLYGGAPTLLLAVWGWLKTDRLGLRERGTRALFVYCVLALGIHLLAAAKEGAYYNYWIEPLWLASVWAIAGLASLPDRAHPGWSLVLLASLALGAISYRPALEESVRQRRAASRVEWLERLRALEGPVLSTNALLALRLEQSGRHPIPLLDSFNAAYLERRGRIELSSLGEAMQAGRIPHLLIEYQKLPSGSHAEAWWPPSTLKALAAGDYSRVEGNEIVELWRWKAPGP